MARGDNYQSFYPTKNLTLLDAKVGQPNGWVSKDGMWAGCIKRKKVCNRTQWCRRTLLKEL